MHHTIIREGMEKSTAHLLIEEDRLDAVTGDSVGLEVAEELEEELPLLWHGLARFHHCQVLLVIATKPHSMYLFTQKAP